MFSSQDHGKMEGSHHLQGRRQLHLGEVSMTWDKVGNDQCLQSDTDIASFLLRYYEDTCAGHQSTACCTHCHTPLALMCPKCISDEKAQHKEKFLQQVKFLQRNEPRMAENQAPAVSASNMHEEIDIPQLPSVDINLPDMMEATSDPHVMTSTVESAIPALMTPQHEPNFQREVNNTEVTYTELTPGDSSGTEEESQASSGNACPHCKCEFAHPVGLTRHLSLQICYTKEGPSVPPILEPPQLSGSDTFKCTLCTSVFFEPDLLTKHMSVHADHMPYNCSECGAGFLKSSVLDLHMQKHKGRYTCTRCKAEFANAIGLTRHMKSSDCKAVAEPAQDKGSENVYAPENMVMESYMPQTQKEDASLKTSIWDDEPQGKFECNKCGKRWTNQYNLERHMLTHTGQRSYACQECGATFLQQCHLVSHVRRKHVPAKPIKCGTCGMTFITSASLEKHDCQPPPPVTQVKKAPLQLLHFHPDRRGRPPKTRPIEPVVSLSSVGLVSGGQNSPAATRAMSGRTTQAPASSTFSEEPDKDTRPHTCSFCRAEFTYATDLTAHLQKHTGQKEFKCSHCDAAFMKAHSLMRHVFKHTEPQQVCSYCGMTFSTSTQLTVHIRTHTGETPFKCDICGAAFREKRNWKIHLRIHTGEKPYLCEDCGRSFSQVNNYRRHTRIHTGERPYACQQCPRTFADKSNLTHHLRMHAGLKPHECSQCGKFFRETYSLKVHMRSHTKEKPYKCPQCDSAFSMDSSLTKHMRIHTGEKPYECPICGRKFANPSNRAAHVRTHKRLNPI